MNDEVNQRDNSIDILKGLGIIFVIIAHVNAIPFDCFVKRAIYAFHMPLFFLVSGYFFKPNNYKEFIIKDAKRLLFPLSVTLFVCSVLFLYTIFSNGIRFYIVRIFYLWTLYDAGPIWFLMALFLCKQFHYLLCKILGPKKTFLLSVILATVIHYFDNYVWDGIIPSVTQCITALPFYALGHIYRIKQRQNPLLPILLIIAYLIYVPFTSKSIVMMNDSYNLYPVEILVGSGGTLLFLNISALIDKTKMSSLIGQIGQYSSLTLCVHTVAMNLGIRNLCSNPVGQIVILILSSIPIAAVMYRFKIVRKVFNYS